MAQNRPRDVAVLELRDGDFAGESAVGLVEGVLRGDFDSFAEVLADEQQVEGGRGDDDFGGGVDGCFVEVGDDLFDGGYGTVPVG